MVDVSGVDLAHAALRMPVQELLVEYLDADGKSPTGEPVTLRDGAGTKHSITVSAGKIKVPNFKPGPTLGRQPKRQQGKPS